MELLYDLFVTASLALVVSFLVAKLLSMATAAGRGHRDSDEPITVEELRSGKQLRVQSTGSQRKAEFPIQAESNLEIEHDRGEIVADSDVLGKVDEFQVDRHLEIEHNREEITVDSGVMEKADEFLVERHSETEHSRGETKVDSDAVKLPVMSPEEKSNKETVSEVSKIVELMEESVQAKTAEVDVCGKTGEFICSPNLGGPAEQSNKKRVEEISKKQTSEKEIPDHSEEITVVKGDEKERDEGREVTVDIEDDWEGIERSELEKVFMAATEFVVGSDSVASIGNDVQMELYGLHKVATEGPCREPQPMPLKLSARAKWNAWQKLGNMSPEVAMEQYVTLLSEKVPGWGQSTSAGKSEHEPARSDDSSATDVGTSLSRQQNIVTQRTLEQESDAQDSLPIESDLENHVTK